MRSMQQRRRVLVASFVAILVLSLAPLSSAAVDDGATTRPAGTADAADRPAPKPGSRSAERAGQSTCTSLVASRYTCVTVTEPDLGLAAPTGKASTRAANVVPTWCTETTVVATRTEACKVGGLRLTTRKVIDGRTVITGEVTSNVWNLATADPDVHYWSHQLSIASYTGWGDALQSSVVGSARSSGSCQRRSIDFPPQAVMPHYTLRHGESSYYTTATAVGAVGFCTTSWDIHHTIPGYPPSTGMSYSMDDIRCDNAAGGAGAARPARVGCVVPWFAEAVLYDRDDYPELALHVDRAQYSGLPGHGFERPLTRTTNWTTVDQNRSLACGSAAPSIPNKSCDEYPLASSNQGLSAGGTLRSFEGCNIWAGTATGPTGASACMIPAVENSAQGGIMSSFYYAERVLNGDPFRVRTTG